MKKCSIKPIIAFALIAIILILVTGCGKTGETGTAETKTGEGKTAEVEDSFSALDSEIEAAKKKLGDTIKQGGYKTLISRTFDQAKVGDVKVVVVAVRNDITKAHDFSGKVEFKKRGEIHKQMDRT